MVKNIVVQEGIWEVFFGIIGYNYDYFLCFCMLNCEVVLFFDLKFVVFDFCQNVIGEIVWCFIDFVNQYYIIVGLVIKLVLESLFLIIVWIGESNGLV